MQPDPKIIVSFFFFFFSNFSYANIHALHGFFGAFHTVPPLAQGQTPPVLFLSLLQKFSG